MMGKLKSRKLWLAIAGITTAVAAALAGEIETAQAIESVVWIVLAYLGVEGGADVVSRIRPRSNGGDPSRFVGLLLVASLAVGATSCTSFRVYDPVTGEQVVSTWGGLLVGRSDTFTVEAEWLDGDNVLQTRTVRRNTEERVDAQLEAMKMVAELAAKAGAASAGVPAP